MVPTQCIAVHQRCYHALWPNVIINLLTAYAYVLNSDNNLKSLILHRVHGIILIIHTFAYNSKVFFKLKKSSPLISYFVLAFDVNSYLVRTKGYESRTLKIK